jgi:hypothetical protein
MKKDDHMKKTTLTEHLDIQNIFEMASAFQWLPERGCVSLALERGSDNNILQTLNNFASSISVIDHQYKLSGNSIQLVLASLANRLDIFNIEGSAVISAAADLAKTIAVDQSLIGAVNFYTVTYALLIRYKFPERWNHFCNCMEKPGWKAVIHTVTAAGLENTVELAESAELPESPISLSGKPVKHCAEEIEAQPSGLGLAFDDAAFYTMSENIIQAAGGGKVVYYRNPDDDTDTGSGSQKDQLERDKLLEELREKAKKKKGSRGV